MSHQSPPLRFSCLAFALTVILLPPLLMHCSQRQVNYSNTLWKGYYWWNPNRDEKTAMILHIDRHIGDTFTGQIVWHKWATITHVEGRAVGQDSLVFSQVDFIAGRNIVINDTYLSRISGDSIYGQWIHPTHYNSGNPIVLVRDTGFIGLSGDTADLIREYYAMKAGQIVDSNSLAVTNRKKINMADLMDTTSISTLGVRADENPPACITRPPKDSASYIYGELKIGGVPVGFALTRGSIRTAPSVITQESLEEFMKSAAEPDTATHLLIIDENTNSDLTDDSVRTWTRHEPREDGRPLLNPFASMYTTINIKGQEYFCLFNNHSQSLALGVRRMDALQGKVNLGGTQYSVLLYGERLYGTYELNKSFGVLYIDLNHDGHFDFREGAAEEFAPGNDSYILGTTAFDLAGFAPDGSVMYVKNRTETDQRRYDAFVGSTVPPIDTLDSKGEAVSIQSFRGKHVVLCFFSDGCGGCDELSSSKPGRIDALIDEIREEKGPAVFLGIKSDNKKPIADGRTVILENGGWSGTLFTRFHIRYMPTVIVIDAEGKIIERGSLGSMRRMTKRQG